MKNLKRILLIDDNVHDNYIHTFIIHSYNPDLKVESVTSGEEAIEYFEKNKHAPESYPFPDLVFLDINMPGMNGFEFLDKAKEMEIFTETTPKVVIMLTSSLNPNEAARAKNEYTNVVIEYKNKPLSIEMLKEIVEDE